MNVDERFHAAFQTFFAGCIKVYTDSCDVQNFPVNLRHEFRFTDGSKYIKVISGSGVYCFVDKTNGDVLKAASWKIPAKHARGNIFDDANGLKFMTPYGAAYMR